MAKGRIHDHMYCLYLLQISVVSISWYRTGKLIFTCADVARSNCPFLCCGVVCFATQLMTCNVVTVFLESTFRK